MHGPVNVKPGSLCGVQPTVTFTGWNISWGKKILNITKTFYEKYAYFYQVLFFLFK